MLSGIGPADDLRMLGIDPVHDLPGVGHNLHDHVDAYVCVRINAPITYTGQDHGLAAIRHGIEYLLFKSGAVTSNACEGGLFASSDGNDDWPDIQLHFMPAMLPSHQMIDGHGVTVLCSALRPRSRGQLRLAGVDPRLDPLIDTNFLADPDDLRVNIAALRVGRAIMNAPSFRRLHGGEVFPGADLTSDTDLGDYVRAFAKTDYHPVGTCRMGTDPMAVVDPALRVRGIDGLRVADASIMPAIVSGNTNAPAIMIGERAAQFIRGNASAAA
jgi:choline dehydrogenase-like flavoprotein